MEQDLIDKLDKAKQEAVDNPPKKKKSCRSCKNKPEVTELPQVELITEPLIIYDEEDIVKAYYETVNPNGIREEAKPFINDVYKQLFNEEFIFNKCVSCKNNQYHKLRNYILYHLKKRI